MRKFESMVDLVRNGCVVGLPARAGSHPRARLWGLLELGLPGSMKDRVALRIVEDAEARGELRPGGVIVESSSGSMAEGLARVGVLKGYRVILVSDPRLDDMMRAKLRALGAELEIVEHYDPQGGWQTSRLRRLREVMERHPDAFWSRQYDSPSNPAAYGQIGEGLADVLGPEVFALVAAVGTGGSLCGVGRGLRRRAPQARLIAVDAVGSVLFNQPDGKRLQSGHGNSVLPGNLDYRMLDEVHWVGDAEAFAGCRELARSAGVFGGGSSGAAWVVASWIAERARPGQHVVVILPDRGDRYHSTIYDDGYLAERGVLAQPAASAPRRIRYGREVAAGWCYAALPHDGSVPYCAAEVARTSDVARELGLEPSVAVAS